MASEKPDSMFQCLHSNEGLFAPGLMFRLFNVTFDDLGFKF